MTQPPKSHTFRGRRYTFGSIRRRGELGGCEGPFVREKRMDIPLEGDSLLDLSTVIHEGVHACLWDLDEEAVTESANDIARLLWRLGWRKQEVED